ncbi:MAG: type IV secretory system conjugative DNA transfer family protein [Anaerolineales bacterium]|nr:type IV secretory system conjugative DNA transfer family protein [Anaerolineales bacterium]
MNLASYLLGHNQLVLSERQRALHSHVIGQSGMGKSKALETWAIQDMLAGRGVGVIDPHGDLFKNLVAWVANRPELWRKVILVDPTDPMWAIGLNPLEKTDHTSSERLALFMTDVCVKLWKLDIANAPRLVWLLTNTFMALSDLGLTLLDLPQFLSDKQYREQKLTQASIPAVRRFFEHEFPISERGAQQWIAPVLNKLGKLLFDPEISLMFVGKNTIDFRKLMDNQMILLVNLPKGILSESLSSLIAAFLVAQIQKAALARTETSHRPPFYLYLDEFQHYTTDNITDILSESRKYRLSLTLAHQYLDQLSDDIKHAVLNTTGNLVSFRVGFDDARVLAKEFFLTPEPIRHVEPHFHLRQSGLRTWPHLEKTAWDDLARKLAILGPRQFWYRRRGSYQPVKEISFWLPDPRMTSEHRKKISELRDFSGNRFARRKADLKQQRETSCHQQDLPLWTA